MNDSVTLDNAKRASEAYNIPESVYLELCENFSNTMLFLKILNVNAPVKAKIDTAFALGLVAGWLKKGGEDEKIEKLFTEKSQS